MRLLTPSGTLAALVIGAAALVAGLRWAVTLVVFFTAATGAGRYHAALKQARTRGLVEKTGPRDHVQVLANGSAFALGCVAFAASGQLGWAAFAAGAIAAASADTWATEVGLLSARHPRSILSGASVPPGTSGGVTLAGTAGGVFGALLIAAASALPGVMVRPLHIFAGGIGGMLLDSVLGATIQERRRCPACGAVTERSVHACGNVTVFDGGVRGFDNDAVNAAATIAGGAVAAFLATVAQ